MIVRIPQLKQRISAKKAIRAAVKAFEGKRKGLLPTSLSRYDVRIDEGFYYPYWIGEVLTLKSRPLFKPKEITFFVICDGQDRGYAVSRALPKMIEIECDERKLLAASFGRKGVEELIEDAHRGINKQFIFGNPHKETKDIFLTHIPGSMVRVKEKETGRIARFFVSGLNGITKVQK